MLGEIPLGDVEREKTHRVFLSTRNIGFLLSQIYRQAEADSQVS